MQNVLDGVLEREMDAFTSMSQCISLRLHSAHVKY